MEGVIMLFAVAYLGALIFDTLAKGFVPLVQPIHGFLSPALKVLPKTRSASFLGLLIGIGCAIAGFSWGWKVLAK
jgi:hypothetical protein